MHTASSELAGKILQKYQGLAPKPVINAVRNASASTGVDFAYLMEKAAAESSFQTKASAKTSSAQGLFQFIDSTWLEMVKAHGGKHGLDRYADAISRDKSGRLSVADGATKSQIMALRNDPRVSALLAAEYAATNKQQLETKVGGKIGATEMYFAHFMGASGASDFLNAMRADDNQLGKDLFPKAAKANKGVFYDPKTGDPRTLGEIYAFFNKRFDGLPTGAGQQRTMLADASDAAIAPQRPADTESAFARPASGPETRPVTRNVHVRSAAPVTIASARSQLARTVAEHDAAPQTRANTLMAGDAGHNGRLAPQMALMILDQVSQSLAQHLPGSNADAQRASAAYSAWA